MAGKSDSRGLDAGEKQSFECKAPAAGIQDEAARRLKVQHIADPFKVEDNPGVAGGMYRGIGPYAGAARIGGRSRGGPAAQ